MWGWLRKDDIWFYYFTYSIRICYPLNRFLIRGKKKCLYYVCKYILYAWLLTFVILQVYRYIFFIVYEITCEVRLDKDDLELLVCNCKPERFLNCGVPAPECLVLGSMLLGSIVLGSMLLGSIVLGSMLLCSMLLCSMLLGSIVLGSTIGLWSKDVLEPCRVPVAQVVPWGPGGLVVPWFPGVQEIPWFPGAQEVPWFPGSGNPFTFIEAGVEGVDVRREGYWPLKF